MEEMIKRYFELERESERLQQVLEETSIDLATAELEKDSLESKKYIRFQDGTLKAITTVQAELVDTVSLSYEPEGKTKDERVANLLRYVRAEYPEYDEYENTLQLIEADLRKIKAKISGKQEIVKVAQKALVAVTEKIRTVGIIIDAMSSQSKAQTFAEMERRLSDKISDLQKNLETQHGELNTHKAVIKEIAAAL